MSVVVPQGRRGWWGGEDLRPRCTEHDKVVFDQEGAERAAARIRERVPNMNAYRANCGHWHVGHSR